MSSIKQIRANRRNAQRSTGPQTPAAKEHVRFNALTHGLRAETVVLPGEDQSKFDQHLARLSAAWLPEDDVEKDFVEQIAVNQWKLARIERSISGTIADLDHYRKTRLQRHKEVGLTETENYKGGAIWGTSEQNRIYILLPQVRGPDGVWRKIPHAVLGDLSQYSDSDDETKPPIVPEPDGRA